MAARTALKRALRPARDAVTNPAQKTYFSRPFSTTVPSLAASSSPSSPSSSSTPDYAIPDPSRPTHFGFQTVTEGEKRERVAGVFTSVAESYDRMNDLMSFGWHRVWKDHFVASLNPGFSPLTSDGDPRGPQHILDVAGGTGDIAFRILHTAHVLNGNPSVRVTMTDINRAMLTVGQQRSARLPASQRAALAFVEANAEDLTRTRPLQPYPSAAEPATGGRAEQAFFDPATATGSVPDASVDLYTVAFGIRNFSNIPAALREARRVLKPGGVFACLEFSKADRHPLFNRLYKEWSFRAIPLIGQLVAADRDSYQYLVESIERFPSQTEFRDMIVDAGFVVAGEGYEDLTGGVAAIHKGMKPRD
ncbi:hypothetical protein VTH06DRAFT_7697 [Thermothelomyces fergusii]